jgi:hypothetical protein
MRSSLTARLHAGAFMTAITVLPVYGRATVVEASVPKAKLECLLVQDAAIAINRSDDPIYGRANVGHEIGPGTRDVLSVRAWEDGNSWDTAQLWKITLEIAPIPKFLPVGKVKHIQVLRSYFTYGGLAWLRTGLYYRAENTVQRIDLTRMKTAFAIVIKGPINATAGIDRLRTAGTWQCNAIRRKLGQLDLWGGKIGTAFDSFHPPKTLRPIETF